MKKIFFSFFALTIIFSASSFSLAANAFEITTYSNMPVEGDFVLGPGKVELFLAPGESASRDLKITNRTGEHINVIIELEDFVGDPDYSTKLLGEEKGPYSLRDYVKPEKDSFSLAHGEKAVLPVSITIPEDAEPGGLYGAVIVRVEPESASQADEQEKVQGQISIISRLATLFFVRVRGETQEEGFLKTFATDKKFYQQGPVDFSIIYENKGNVHLDPYADIEIKNIMGKKIDEVEVLPWFVMPGFSRNRIISWNKNFAFGRYTAHVSLNRGYDNIVDEAEVSFWVIPMKVLVIGILIILFISFVIWWFGSRFELKRRE